MANAIIGAQCPSTNAPEAAPVLRLDDDQYIHLWSLLEIAHDRLSGSTDCDHSRAAIRAAMDYMEARVTLLDASPVIESRNDGAEVSEASPDALEWGALEHFGYEAGEPLALLSMLCELVPKAIQQEPERGMLQAVYAEAVRIVAGLLDGEQSPERYSVEARAALACLRRAGDVLSGGAALAPEHEAAVWVLDKLSWYVLNIFTGDEAPAQAYTLKHYRQYCGQVAAMCEHVRVLLKQSGLSAADLTQTEAPAVMISSALRTADSTDTLEAYAEAFKAARGFIGPMMDRCEALTEAAQIELVFGMLAGMRALLGGGVL